MKTQTLYIADGKAIDEAEVKFGYITSLNLVRLPNPFTLRRDEQIIFSLNADGDLLVTRTIARPPAQLLPAVIGDDPRDFMSDDADYDEEKQF